MFQFQRTNSFAEITAREIQYNNNIQKICWLGNTEVDKRGQKVLQVKRNSLFFCRIGEGNLKCNIITKKKYDMQAGSKED